jgi:hypothetical protein
MSTSRFVHNKHPQSARETKPAESNSCPFCCSSNIPSSFKHLFYLLPQNTTHHPLSIPMSSTAILTSFLSSGIHTNLAPTPTHPFSYYAIIEVLQRFAATSTLMSKHYFVPVLSGAAGLGPGQLVKCWKYREITRVMADESIRPKDSGIEIGDGEKWIELPGVEKLHCEAHQCVFELRVWVRESLD